MTGFSFSAVTVVNIVWEKEKVPGYNVFLLKFFLNSFSGTFNFVLERVK